MREVIHLPDERALREHVERSYRGGIVFDSSKVTIRPYATDDVRTGWKNVHIVSSPQWGIIGFCTYETPFDDQRD